MVIVDPLDAAGWEMQFPDTAEDAGTVVPIEGLAIAAEGALAAKIEGPGFGRVGHGDIDDLLGGHQHAEGVVPVSDPQVAEEAVGARPRLGIVPVRKGSGGVAD